MLGGTLALTTRSLRLDARLLRSHLFRLMFVVIILLGLITAHYMSLGLGFGAPGLQFFTQMAWLNFAFITLAAMSFFATAITEEKEEETLGLLKMAGLNSVSILLGKWAPRLASALLLLSVQFPFTLLAITLGGVTMRQVWAAYVALLAYMFLVSNLGLFCSVVRRRSSSAASMSVMLLLVYLFGVPFARLMFQSAVQGGVFGAEPWVAVVSSCLETLYASTIVSRLISSIMQTGFDESLFSLQVASNVVGGCALFGLAWAAFDVCTREQKPITPERTWAFRRTSRLGELGISRAWSWAAVIWKDFYFITGGVTFLIVKSIAYPAVAVPIYWLLDDRRRRFDWQDFGEFALVVTTVGMVLETSIFASRLFHEEVKWKTLPALMMLPQSTARIAYSKVIGCLLSLTPALLYFTIATQLSPREFDRVVNEFAGNPGAWFAVLQFLMFLHLTAYLSLSIKWGALPLSFALIYISFGCCLQPVALTGVVAGNGEGLWAFFSFVELVIIAALHPLIGYKLQEQAAK